MTPKASPRLLITVTSTGRQASSVVRAAAAVGYRVRAQVYRKDDLVAQELNDLKNVTVVEGSLEDSAFIRKLFKGGDVAFINTAPFYDEVVVGKSLADAARAAGIKHYVYSSMPDHSTFGRGWKPLPYWACKFTVETYVRTLKDMPSTFVYTGCYNNNFTSLRYPLFGLELQADGSFIWQAPFHPDYKIPWLDPEHDMGPALLQILSEGSQWFGHKIPLTFEVLTPKEACEAFSRGIGRRVKYRRGPIEFHVPNVPSSYRKHLVALQEVLGDQGAEYFGPTMYYPNEALKLWEGNRSIEEYAREIFPCEEEANGLTWMDEDDGEDSSIIDGEGSVRSAGEVRAEAEQNYPGSC